MKKTLIVLGAGVFQVPLITLAQKQGLTVVVCDQSAEAPGISQADAALLVSTRNVLQLIQAVNTFLENNTDVQPLGVMTIGTDVPYSVACLAQSLGVPGLPPEVALKTQRKDLMRRAFQSYAVPSPEFRVLTHASQLELVNSQLEYPLVVKPVDNMGARGVRKVESFPELKRAFRSARKHSRMRRVIVEQYLAGREVSVDSLWNQGVLHPLTIAERHIVGEPYFVEMGHTVPAVLDAAIEQEIWDVMAQGARALGVWHGALKADLKITAQGVMIGEMTARLSGGFHSQFTDPLATGLRSIEAALELALQEPLDLSKVQPRWQRCAVERAIPHHPGRVSAIRGVQEAQAVPGVQHIFLNAEVGQTLEALTSNIGKAGHVIAVAETRDQAQQRAEQALKCITVETV